MNIPYFKPLFFVLFLLVSCLNNQEEAGAVEENTAVEKKEKKIEIPENAYHFKSVAYDYYIQFEDQGKSAVITSGHINMKLPQRNTWPEGAEYAKDSIVLFTGVKENALINNGVKENLILVNPKINAYTNDTLFAVVEFHKRSASEFALIRLEDGPYVKLGIDTSTEKKLYTNEEFTLHTSGDTLFFEDKLGSEIVLYKID